MSVGKRTDRVLSNLSDRNDSQKNSISLAKIASRGSLGQQGGIPLKISKDQNYRSSGRINLNKKGSPLGNDSIEIAELPPKRPRRGKLEKLDSRSAIKL